MDVLPNFQSAHIDDAKLRDYCLNDEHPTGKFKARVFKSTLNITKKDALILKENILIRLGNYEAKRGLADKYGVRFYVDINMRIFDKAALVRTVWIIKAEENFPRLITCYSIDHD